MIVNVKAKAINGLPIEPKIDITIASLSFGSDLPQASNPVSTRVLSQTLTELVRILQKYYPKANLEKPRLYIVSKDLEMMNSLGILPDSASLSRELTVAVISFIAGEMGFSTAKGSDIEGFLKSSEAEFFRVFQGHLPREISNPSLIRVRELYKDKKYQEAFRLLATIAGQLTEDNDSREADFLAFSLRIKHGNRSPDQIEQEFRVALKKLGDRPDYVKKYYFEYIRYLEDARDFYIPFRLLNEFRDKYPLNLLDGSEKTSFHHLQGRAEYARGDYLQALENFCVAIDILDPADSESYARILNSSVNCFSDNLFFEEAVWIAEKAAELRSLLNLPETLETLSCIAGINTKQHKHREAYEVLQQVATNSSVISLTPVEQNRLNNYLAKSLTFMGDFSKAEAYLVIAEEAGDPKGFSCLLRLLLLFRKNNFPAQERLFTDVFILPENHDQNKGFDRFVLGWAYTLMGETSLIKKDYKDAVLYLNDGISFFLSDQYVLEAKCAALLTWVHGLPESYALSFRQMQDNLKLDELFDQYVKKHARIAELYFGHFKSGCQKHEEESALALLAKRLYGMDDYNYDPSEIKEILASICLI